MFPVTLLPATVEELAAGERDGADGTDGATGSRRRPVVLAAVATGVLMVGTAGWVVMSRSVDGSGPTAGPTQSRQDPAYVDGFGLNTASAATAGPPISRGTPRPPAPSGVSASAQASAGATGTAGPATSVRASPPQIAPQQSPAPSLLSRGRPATASSVEDNQSWYQPSRAVDGDLNSRWASAYGDQQQWIVVDLGSSRQLSEVQLRWEVAYARRYEVQLSADRNNWNTVATVSTGNGGIDEHDISGTARYVRILCQQRGTEWGYSLWELNIYGN